MKKKNHALMGQAHAPDPKIKVKAEPKLMLIRFFFLLVFFLYIKKLGDLSLTRQLSRI